MTKTHPLCHNYGLRLPGYSGTFLTPQMHFDPIKRTLQVHTDQGDVLFTVDDKVRVFVMDLDIPACVREQMIGEGWEEMPVGELVHTLLMDYNF